eukprot:645482-Amorphochlora_amoeboformis.AAC.1
MLIVRGPLTLLSLGLGLALRLALRLALGSDYSECLSPRTIDSPMIRAGTSARVRVRVRVKARVRVRVRVIDGRGGGITVKSVKFFPLWPKD